MKPSDRRTSQRVGGATDATPPTDFADHPYARWGGVRRPDIRHGPLRLPKQMLKSWALNWTDVVQARPNLDRDFYIYP